ncbi:LytR/AlgR family response regulator transcription factor [Marinirhabdus gelatinilytica]|uniref:LytTr DNA-binding domain-containing protein n=1 Tax=Marinirhabdus gelatinilytica TaxID=1703343 RepID=A0A370QAZ6_9FLAO|nr:LytTR family DNA-binding domain-containing protein [Marinirhabdus gelatinilytica]RDK85551.1 LytTr DNA-binding domain-containing protein [Marinirhabdus gelatinilytica]
MSTRQPTGSSTPKEQQTLATSDTWRWSQKLILFIVFSLVVNHLTTRDSFPGSDRYRFPIEGFLSSIALCILIGTIAELNFNFYKKKYFSKKVEIVSISWYMVTTLGYVTAMYIPLSVLLNKIAGGETEFYYLLIGLLITLLLSFILISLAYAQDIYNLYRLSIKDAEITIESGAKTTKLTYGNIACFYSENKIVYTVQNDGTTITTDFTLNELEEKINDQLFFRANRQMIIHKDAVDQIEKIENGKLRVRLKASVENDAIAEINISRYKRKAFMAWFQ